jgi:2-C-methyl-D-erythritol 2,4-cyclodiphosphate synthase
MVHVGIGYDIHALVAGRKLILGGVEIPHPKGLDGHSDADALMHAICDALLGALGEPDIGHFSRTPTRAGKMSPAKFSWRRPRSKSPGAKAGL